jgi:hypothetical protein
MKFAARVFDLEVWRAEMLLCRNCFMLILGKLQQHRFARVLTRHL